MGSKGELLEALKFVERGQIHAVVDRSLPLAEARDALLATHAGEEALSHEHGAPARLVAPGRRGFQWVKWVVRVEALTEPDLGEIVAIHTSSLSPAGRGQ